MSITLNRADGWQVTATPAGHEVVEFARAEMERYLKAMLGLNDGGKEVPVRLCLVEDADLGDEGYEQCITAKGVDISGGGPAGIVYGVYNFLEHFGGCRFSGLGSEGEYVPRREKLIVPLGVRRRKPRLWYRGMQFSGMQPLDLTLQRIDWMAKNGMNDVMVHIPIPPLFPASGAEKNSQFDPATGRQVTVDRHDQRFDEDYVRKCLLPEIRKRGMKISMNHHNMFFWLPPREYFRDHPEWYALQDGERRWGGQQLCVCTSNSEAVATMIENIKDYLRRTPETLIVGVIPEDGIGMCQCDACRALDYDPDDAFRKYTTHRRREKHFASKSRRYALLLNQIARALRAEFPAVLLGAGAYVDLQWPAPDVKLESNVVPWLAIYWRCGAHPLQRDVCPMNDFFRRLIEEWRAAHDGKLILYEYYMGMGSQANLPYPMADVITREWRELKKMGVAGATVQSRSDHHPIYAHNYLTFARVGWDDVVDAGQILDDYLLGYFGDAGRVLRPFFQYFEVKRKDIETGQADSPYLKAPKAVPPAIGCLLPNARNIAYFFDDEGMKILRDCLEHAAKLKLGAREQKQLAGLKAAAKYWELAARMVRDGYQIARMADDGNTQRAAEMANAALQEFAPALEQFGNQPALDGWRRPDVARRNWRGDVYECGQKWLATMAAGADSG